MYNRANANFLKLGLDILHAGYLVHELNERSASELPT